MIKELFLKILKEQKEAANDNPDKKTIQSQITASKRAMMKLPPKSPARNFHQAKIDSLSKLVD